jgi:alanine racemase
MSAGRLTIDLDAVAANWQALKGRQGTGECAAVVKADAYGLGMEPVARALWRAGCRTFFVALLDEALCLRTRLPEAAIHVLNGLERGGEEETRRARLVPVLNGPDDIERWSALAGRAGASLPAALHLDTGMARLGLSPAEARNLAAHPDRLAGIDLTLVMSHLACADEPDHPLNDRQLALFRDMRALFPQGRSSLANSSGLFLGDGYRSDLARPGAALYGVNPCPGKLNPMAQVVRLQGEIIRVRDIDSGESVGYGASWRAARRTRLATVAVGYGDGYPRSLGNSGFASLDGVRVPVVGRVSMDLITLDVTEAADKARPGAWLDLIGAGATVDDLAAAAGTIGYEILTGLGARYRRSYSGGGA